MPAGVLLREWRTRRRFSQLDLAYRAEVSPKHLSHIETGRSRPSPEMILHLCEHLDVPLGHRNEILLAAGHAPRYQRRDFAHDRELQANVERIVNSHPYPAVVVDADWNLVSANAAAMMFLEGVAPELLAAPANVIRLSLHPDGLATRVVNFDAYAAHVLARVRRSAEHNPSPVLRALLDEFEHLARHVDDAVGLILPLEISTPKGIVRMFSTITTFGAPRDVTLDELAIETFYPADDESAALLV